LIELINLESVSLWTWSNIRLKLFLNDILTRIYFDTVFGKIDIDVSFQEREQSEEEEPGQMWTGQRWTMVLRTIDFRPFFRERYHYR